MGQSISVFDLTHYWYFGHKCLFQKMKYLQNFYTLSVNFCQNTDVWRQNIYVVKTLIPLKINIKYFLSFSVARLSANVTPITSTLCSDVKLLTSLYVRNAVKANSATWGAVASRVSVVFLSTPHSLNAYFFHDYWINIGIYSRKITSEISTDAPYNSSSTARASKFKRLTTTNNEVFILLSLTQIVFLRIKKINVFLII